MRALLLVGLALSQAHILMGGGGYILAPGPSLADIFINILTINHTPLHIKHGCLLLFREELLSLTTTLEEGLGREKGAGDRPYKQAKF